MREPPVGHEQTRERLMVELPSQPVLLLGPESIGKWLMARWVSDYHAPWFNQWSEAAARVDRIRELRKFLATAPAPAPMGSGFKVVTVNLDGAKSAAVQHAMLKELEEPPDYARFILTASRSPLATISSRCVIWRWGPLTDAEVASVLMAKGIAPREAEKIAPAGCGRVAPALAVASGLGQAKSSVLGVIRAIAARDKDLLERVVKGWGETEDWLLRELLGAAASGRPTTLFTSSERQLLGRTSARRGIALLAASGRARPQVSVRALAGAMMAEERR